MKRREFISTSLAAGIVAAGALAQSGGHPGGIPRRAYGKESIPLSIIGFGGIIVMNETPEDSAKYVAAAYDRGINYYDVAPTYGNAQERLGPALKPFREDVFLACKTEQRGAPEAQAALEESLRLLETDHFDLYQLHGMVTDEDVDRAFGPGGAMEVFIKAKEDGKALHLGFSAHSDNAAVRALDLYDFDSVLFPLNCVTWTKGNFGHATMEKAQQKGASLLALKGMAWTGWDHTAQVRSDWPKCWYQPISEAELARLALSFTLGLPVTAAVPPGDWRAFQMACDIAESYQPLSEDELGKLHARMEDAVPIFETA